MTEKIREAKKKATPIHAENNGRKIEENKDERIDFEWK